MGANGYTIPIETEFMLIFGGITARDITFTDPIDGTVYDIYNNCELYETITSNKINETFATCGEELLNDIWIYNVLSGEWFYMKPGINEDRYLYPMLPSARYGHTGQYVELPDLSSTYPGTNITATRKYLFIYGGFSFDC